jgi:hypothetical protein
MPTKSKTRRCQEAEECLRAGDYQTAIDSYRTLVADYPDEESLLLALAWAYYDAGRQDQAIRCFEQLFHQELSRNIFTGFAYDELVRILRTSRQYDRLVDVCTRAVAAWPDDIALLKELGTAYLQAGMTRKAKVVCRRAIARPCTVCWGRCTWPPENVPRRRKRTGAPPGSTRRRPAPFLAALLRAMAELGNTNGRKKYYACASP